MMTHLIQSALILTLFYTAYRIIFQRFTFFQHNRIFLLSGLGLSLALPFLPLNFSKERMEYVYLPKNYFDNMPVEISTETSSSFFWQEWTLNEWLISAYFMGVAVFTFIMLLQVIQVSLLISKGNLIRKDGMKLVLTEKTTSPFSFFNTIVMNPKMLSEEQLGHIVTHENIHISQWHQLDVVMAEILKIVLWFFPVSWWYGKSIRTNLEFIADTNSLENGLDKKNYQLNLVSISQQPSGSVLVNNFSKKLIKNRIKMLNKMKTKKQILSFYAVLIPALVLISVGISVQAQSQNEKVKQVIVLSDEKIEPEDLKIQIKNENGEFQDLDSVNLKLVETSNFSNGSSIVMNFDGNVSELETQKFPAGKILNPNKLNEIKPNEISSINVINDENQQKLVIIYKDLRKADTIIYPAKGVSGYAYSFKDSDKILSPKELKMKIQKGEIDLNNPKNKWLKKWKDDKFKEPIDYSDYHQLLENWDGKPLILALPKTSKTFSTEDLKNLPDGMTFEADSIKLNSPWEITVQQHDFHDDVLNKYKSGHYKIDTHYTEQAINFSGNNKENAIDKLLKSGKKPLIFINGKKSSINDYKKIRSKDGYTITYTSKGKALEKYGKKAKDGLLIINSRQYIAQ